MPYSTCNRRRRWRNRLALTVACAAFPLLAAAAPSSATTELFCPAGGGTISLAAFTGCTNSVRNLLTEIVFYNARAVNHCAVGKATSDPGGSSSNVTAAVCGYGPAGVGDVHSLSPGSWGYARGTNQEPVSFGYFWGTKTF